MSRNVLLLVVAIVCFVFALVAGESNEEVLLTFAGWQSAGLVAFTAAHLP